MKLFLTLAAVSLLAATSPAQQYDDNGTLIGGGPGANAPGAVLNTWTGPSTRGTGLAHNGELLYMISSYDGLAIVNHLRDTDGAVLGSTSIANTTDYECAWDDKRELIVTTNASTDVVYGYTTAGVQVFAWPFPSTGHVGIAWDCRRDVYWLCDWTTNTLFSLDAATGIPTGVSFSTAAVGITRVSGVAYDANTDTLYVGGRDQSLIVGMYAVDGSAVCSFPAAEPSSNAIGGLTVAPRGSIFANQYANSNHFEMEGCHGLRPQLRFSPNFPVAGNAVTLTMGGLMASERAIFAYSLTGCGPTTSPIGDMLLSNPRSVLAIIPANGAGVSSLTGVIPGGLSGATIYFHGGGLAGSGRCNNAVINP